MLARCDHSERELSGKLSQRGCSAEEIDSALKKLRERGYIDDRAFGRNLAKNLWNSGKYGIAGVRYQLRNHGLAETAICEAIAGLECDLELSYAISLLERRKLCRNHKDKAGRFLAARGFTYNTIERALEQLPHEQ